MPTEETTDAMDAMALPGMTRIMGDPCISVKPVAPIVATQEKKYILLATATITNENVFSNGLFQNVFIFYRMFESMGYKPVLIIHEKPESPDKMPPMLRDCRMMVSEEIIMKPIPVLALLEIGMSIDPLLREFVKMLGGRLMKVYLGNILNIDIETPMFYPQMNFAHHVIEKIDTVLVSPHYGQHAEYAAHINHVQPPEKLDDMIAPYVWDPCFISKNGAEVLPAWTPCESADRTFVIMEPNISFQKSSFIPILALERWYRRVGKASGWKGKIVVVNGDRIAGTPHFSESILPVLTIAADNRIEFTDRKDILTAMRTWSSAIFVGHQFNNEYNYMTLELMWCGFPIVHNSASWGDFGYFYDGNNLDMAVKQIHAAHIGHTENQELYKSHSRILAWKHSPYNPDIHTAWNTLLIKK